MAEKKTPANTKKPAKSTAKKSNTNVAAAKKTSTTKKVAPTNKKTTNTVEKKHISQKSKDNSLMILSIVLGVLVILLIGAISYMYLSQDEKNSTPNVPINGNADSIKLLVIEDPSCTNCDVDLFITQVKDNLITNLEAEKISFESSRGETIINELDIKQVPVYLFSKNIDERSDWKTELEGAFIMIQTEGKNYYMLNPQIIPNKIMIEAPVITDSAIVIGDNNAPVTVMIFSDFECPFCAIAEGNEELVMQFRSQNPSYQPPMPKIYDEYVDTGLVKVVFYNYYPSHPSAEIVHLAALCANEQGMWREYSNIIWDEMSLWSKSNDRSNTLKEYASDLNLNTQQFNECLDSKKYSEQLIEEMVLGQGYGVSGTPSFFVGKTFISGAQDYSTFKQLIDVELNN